MVDACTSEVVEGRLQTKDVGVYRRREGLGWQTAQVSPRTPRAEIADGQPPIPRSLPDLNPDQPTMRTDARSATVRLQSTSQDWPRPRPLLLYDPSRSVCLCGLLSSAESLPSTHPPQASLLSAPSTRTAREPSEAPPHSPKSHVLWLITVHITHRKERQTHHRSLIQISIIATNALTPIALISSSSPFSVPVPVPAVPVD